MTARDDTDWTPTPELLAAFFDGELEAADRAWLRRRVADWLDANPDAREELAAYRQLAQLWRDTTPPAPDETAWRRVLARVVAATRPRRAPGVRRRAAALAAVAAMLVVALGVWLRWPGSTEPAIPLAATSPAVDDEVFPVATASEVTILRVEGSDTETLVVGTLPVHGPLELALPGEVSLTSVQPDAHDNMVPRVLLRGPSRPMIWARLDTEHGEP